MMINGVFDDFWKFTHLSLILDLCGRFIHILEGYFTGTRPIILPQYQCSTTAR